MHLNRGVTLIRLLNLGYLVCSESEKRADKSVLVDGRNEGCINHHNILHIKPNQLHRHQHRGSGRHPKLCEPIACMGEDDIGEKGCIGITWVERRPVRLLQTMIRHRVIEAAECSLLNINRLIHCGRHRLPRDQHSLGMHLSAIQHKEEYRIVERRVGMQWPQWTILSMICVCCDG